MWTEAAMRDFYLWWICQYLELFSQYSSDKDSDYEPPDYVQEEILEESPLFTRSMASQMEKEEAMRRLLETKMNRYPLRHYINLGTGFDVQLRPNYYESDQEEEEANRRKRTRRHSISTSLGQEEEEDNGEKHNLHLNENEKTRQRSFSEGWKEGNVGELNSCNDKSVSKSDSVCITRTLTYTSKRQVLKLYQTEHLSLDVSQNRIVGRPLCANNLYPEEQRELNELVEKFNCVIPRNGFEENERVQLRRKLLEYEDGTAASKGPSENLLNTDLHYDGSTNQKEMEAAWRNLQRWNVDPKSYRFPDNLNPQSYFLGQLGLKHRPQCEQEKMCKRKADDEGVENYRIYQEKYKKYLEKVAETEKLRNEERMVKKKKVSHNSLIESGSLKNVPLDTEKTGKSVSVTSEIKSVNMENMNKTPDKNTTSKKEKFSNKKNKAKYRAFMMKDCQNLFQPDFLLRNDSVLVKNIEPNRKTIETNATQSNHGRICVKERSQEKIQDCKKTREKVTLYKDREKASLSQKLNHREKPKMYNLADLKNKLKRLFGDPLNKNLLEKNREEKKYVKNVSYNFVVKEKKKIQQEMTSKLDRNKWVEKPSQYCILHKEKANSEKRTKRELEKLKNGKELLKTEKVHFPKSDQIGPKSSKDVDIGKTKKEIDILKRKRRALGKVKSALEKKWCSKTCPKNSYSKLREFRKKTKESQIPAESTENVVESSKSSITKSHHRPFEIQSKSEKLLSKKDNAHDVENKTDQCLEKNVETTSENNSINERNSTDEAGIEEQSKQATPSCEKTVQNLEIAYECCCCSENSPNKEPLQCEKNCDSSTSAKDKNPPENSTTTPEGREIPEVISLCENSMDGTESENPITVIDRCCCCCSSPPSTEDISINTDKSCPKEIISIDITDDCIEENSESTPEANIIVLDENDTETEDNAISKQDENNKILKDGSKKKIGAEKTSVQAGTDKENIDAQEDMFPEESEEDQDLQDLIRALTDSIDTVSSPQQPQNGNECITKGSNRKPTPEDAPPSMTGMEHYKKRLIHQHEKPGNVSSPCTTTTEEEDDSLESPLSPASSVQSRDSGQRDKRKEEVVAKVARKRAVCRSQFRHQNMELFKLGSSIPTSLCKTKEPYNVCAEKNLQMCYQNGGVKKSDRNPSKGSLTESILSTMDGAKKRDVPLWRSVSLNNETTEKQGTYSNSNNTENKISNSGRHILPAIVPELPEHRRSRIKSLPEGKGFSENTKTRKSGNGSGNVYEFAEETGEAASRKNQHVEGATKKSCGTQSEETRDSDGSSLGVKETSPAFPQNVNLAAVRRQSTSSTETRDAESNTHRRPSTSSTERETRSWNTNVTSTIRRESTSSTDTQEILEARSRNTNFISRARRQSTSSTETQEIVEAHSHNATRRRQSTSSDSDVIDCAPMNLSLKHRGDEITQPSWTDLVNVHQSKRNEVTSNQHLTQAIPRQPNNVPKKPHHLSDETVKKTALDQNIARAIASEGAHVDKDGNCFFVTSIPGNALDPQKQSNVIVINFPHIQQQMGRMEKPNTAEVPQSPLEMLDSAIMSLVNIVKSSVESVFNIMSLPVLNRLYIDLSRYLLLRTVSVKMKMCIEEALNSLISYLLVNLFHAPRTSKAKNFMHKMMLLDLRPHMDFLINSLAFIQQRIKYDQFMEELLKVLSRNPQENFPVHLPRAQPVPRQYFPGNNLPFPPDVRDFPRSGFWMDGPGYQHRSEPLELLSGPPRGQPQKRGRRMTHDGPPNVRGPENFAASNLAMIRPDLYLADNRCIPPNPQIHHEQFYMQTPSQPRPKGRPRNSAKTNKTASKPTDNPLLLSPGVGMSGQIYNRRQSTDNATNQNTDTRGRINHTFDVHRSGDITSHTEITPENLNFRNRPRLTEEKRLSEGALVANKVIENTGNLFNIGNVQQIPRQEMIPANHKVRNDNIPFGGGHLAYAPFPVPPSDDNVNPPPNKVPRMETLNFKEVPSKMPFGLHAVPTGNEKVQMEQMEEARLKNPPIVPASEHENVARPGAAPDVEQFLQTNIIVNKNQAPGVIRGSVLENVVPKGKSTEKASVIVSDEKKTTTTGKFEDVVKSDTKSDECSVFNLNRVAGSNAIDNKKTHSEKRERSIRSRAHTKEEKVATNSVISSTVIIKDESMVISKGGASSEEKEPAKAMDLDDVVVERVSPNVELKENVSYDSARSEAPKDGAKDDSQIEEDVSIEKVIEAPPKLIRLAALKRKFAQDEKKPKKLKLGETVTGEVVIIEDDENIEYSETLDCNQNDVSKSNKSGEVTDITESAETQENENQKSAPLIEDISSDEEPAGTFRLYSAYKSKIVGHPKGILQSTEVSECTLIEGNVQEIQNCNRHLFEQPPVYTRPVLPRKLLKFPVELEPMPKREPLTDRVRFEENGDSFTCSLKVKNNRELKYPDTMDVQRFSPGTAYLIPAEDTDQAPGAFSPNFKSPPRPLPMSPARAQTSPVVPRSPRPQTSPVVQTSPVMLSPAVQMSPVMVSPAVQMSPVMVSPVVQMSPVMTSPVVQMSPVGPAAHPLNESDLNWRHWFAEEQRKGVFNFERSQSLESSTLSGRQSVETDYSPKMPPEEPLCEIKVDSKVCRIKKSLFERIPKGKLCYIRESNTFVRYFDNNQMELFIRNLNLGEGSTAAKDLLKQVRGRGEGPTDVETSPGQGEASQKGEVITLSKDVVFSTDDFLSDPELYVEEVEKVQRYVPKDFYGFYKFVTGYQIVNHHPPISFQTFLTMHNTNGIRGLFKNYVNTLVEGRNVL